METSTAKRGKGRPPEPSMREYDEIVREMWREGRTRREIARTIYVSPTTVADRLRAMKLTRRDKWSSYHGDILRLREEGATLSQICQKLGLSYGILRGRFKVLGIPTSKPTPSGEEIRALRGEGLSISQVARKLGVCTTTVWRKSADKV